MQLTTFGYSLIVLCLGSFVIGVWRRAEWLANTLGVLAGIGFLYTIMMWYVAHYVPTPYGAGVIMMYGEDVEIELQIGAFIEILVWASPLLSYGFGGWLREKRSHTATRHRELV